MWSNLTFEGDSYYLNDSTVVGLGVFFIVYVAVIIIAGMIGNFFCIIMFTRTNFLKRSSSQYLMALALTDFGFLLSLSIVWLNELGVRWYHLPVILMLTSYTSSLCSSLSSWIIVAFTFERFLVVFFPLKCKTVCSPSRARAVVVAISVFAAVFNLWVPLDIARIHRDVNCTEDHSGSFDYYRIFDTMSEIYDSMVVLDTILSLALPAVLISVFDVLIGFHLINVSHNRLSIAVSIETTYEEQRRVDLKWCCCHKESGSENNSKTFDLSLTDEIPSRRSRNLNEETVLVGTTTDLTKPRSDNSKATTVCDRKNSTCAPGSASKLRRLSHISVSAASRMRVDLADTHVIRKEKKITRTLVCIATFYLVANIPSYIVRLLSRSDKSESFRVAQTLAFMLSYAQFSANFYLYSLTGHNVIPRILATFR